MNENLKKNAIWNTVGITFNAFNSLFLLIVINRVNGIENAGIFSFAFSIACLFYIIGMYSGRSFQVSDIKNDLNDKEYFIHKMMTCFLMLITTIAFILIQGYAFEKSLIIFVLCFYKNLEALSDTLYGYLQKNNQLYIVGKSLFLKSFIGIIVFLILDLITKDLFISCLGLMLNSIIFIILYDMQKIKNLVNKSNIDIKKVFRFSKIGFSVFAFSFFSVYIVNVPKYIIDIFLDSKFQTIFNIIVMPGTVVSLCGQYIMPPLLVDLVELYECKNYVAFKQMIIKIARILIVMAIGIEVCAVFLGIPVLNFIYMVDLKDFKLDLILIILGAILYALAGIISTALITMQKNNTQLLIYITIHISSLKEKNKALIQKLSIMNHQERKSLMMINKWYNQRGLSNVRCFYYCTCV